MTRFIALLAALLFSWLGVLQPGSEAAATPDTPTAAHAFAYDGAVTSARGTYTTERGPPSTTDRLTTNNDDGLRPIGTLVRPDHEAITAPHRYDRTQLLVRIASASHESERLGGAARAKPAVVERSSVAAHPGSLIEQSSTTTAGVRRPDILTQGLVGIESQVGRTSLTATTLSQIAKDSLLLRNGDVNGIEWVFSRSGVTGEIGLTGPLTDALSKAEIQWSLAP